MYDLVLPHFGRVRFFARAHPQPPVYKKRQKSYTACRPADSDMARAVAGFERARLDTTSFTIRLRWQASYYVRMTRTRGTRQWFEIKSAPKKATSALHGRLVRCHKPVCKPMHGPFVVQTVPQPPADEVTHPTAPKLGGSSPVAVHDQFSHCA